MNTLYNIIIFASQSNRNLITTLLVILFAGVALYFSLIALFPIVVVKRKCSCKQTRQA